MFKNTLSLTNKHEERRYTTNHTNIDNSIYSMVLLSDNRNPTALNTLCWAHEIENDKVVDHNEYSLLLDLLYSNITLFPGEVFLKQ